MGLLSSREISGGIRTGHRNLWAFVLSIWMVGILLSPSAQHLHAVNLPPPHFHPHMTTFAKTSIRIHRSSFGILIELNCYYHFAIDPTNKSMIDNVSISQQDFSI